MYIYSYIDFQTTSKLFIDFVLLFCFKIVIDDLISIVYILYTCRNLHIKISFEIYLNLYDVGICIPI